MHNYADDNTVSCSDNSLENVICKLSEDSVLLIMWFLNNKMKANLEKNQAIAVGEKHKLKILLLILIIMLLNVKKMLNFWE